MISFRYFVLCFLVINLSSCAQKNYSNAGKLSFYSSNKKSFTFTVSEEYIKSNALSKQSKQFPRMTEAEMDLLIHLLKNNNYCINKSGKLSFLVTSKQEKIYDMTFSSLIEQNYNAKPVTPTTYFGVCN